jgi:hypothetical protein
MMGSRGVRLVLAASTVSALLATGIARAQQPTAADRETARSLMQEGRELREKGHVQDALKRFKAADDIMHVPTTALEVARTQAAVGQLIEARDTIANIRKGPTAPNDPEPFKEARAKAEELDSSLEGRIPALTIVVSGAAPGETPSIVVDGIPVPAAAVGLPRRVNAGRHTVVAKTATASGDQTVDVKEGEQKEVQVTLSASNPGAPSTDQPVPNPGPPEPETAGATSHSPTILTYAGIGVGAAGVITGAITGLMSMSKTSALKNECIKNHCYSGHGLSDYNAANTLATVSDVAFAVGAVGAGVAVVTILLGHPASSTPAESSPQPPAGAEPGADTPPASQSRLHVTPWIGFGSAGVSGVF